MNATIFPRNILTYLKNTPKQNPNMAAFTSINGMMSNIGNVMTKQMMGNFATIIKITLHEYEESSFKVGDRLTLKIDKTIAGL